MDRKDKHRCNNWKETMVEWLIFQAFTYDGIYVTRKWIEINIGALIRCKPWLNG